MLGLTKKPTTVTVELDRTAIKARTEDWIGSKAAKKAAKHQADHASRLQRAVVDLGKLEEQLAEERAWIAGAAGGIVDRDEAVLAEHKQRLARIRELESERDAFTAMFPRLRDAVNEAAADYWRAVGAEAAEATKVLDEQHKRATADLNRLLEAARVQRQRIADLDVAIRTGVSMSQRTVNPLQKLNGTIAELREKMTAPAPGKCVAGEHELLALERLAAIVKVRNLPTDVVRFAFDPADGGGWWSVAFLPPSTGHWNVLGIQEEVAGIAEEFRAAKKGGGRPREPARV